MGHKSVSERQRKDGHDVVCVCGGGLNWQEEWKLKIEIANEEGGRPEAKEHD